MPSRTKGTNSPIGRATQPGHDAEFQRHAERVRGDLEMLAQGERRGGRHMPGLAIGVGRRIEQRDRGAGIVVEMGDIVRQIGIAEQPGGLAFSQRLQ